MLRPGRNRPGRPPANLRRSVRRPALRAARARHPVRSGTSPTNAGLRSGGHGAASVPTAQPRSRGPVSPDHCRPPSPARPASWHARRPGRRARLARAAPPTPGWPHGPGKGSAGRDGGGPRVPLRWLPAAPGHRHGPSPADGNKSPPRPLAPGSGHSVARKARPPSRSKGRRGPGPAHRRGGRHWQGPPFPPLPATGTRRGG